CRGATCACFSPWRCSTGRRRRGRVDRRGARRAVRRAELAVSHHGDRRGGPGDAGGRRLHLRPGRLPGRARARGPGKHAQVARAGPDDFGAERRGTGRTCVVIPGLFRGFCRAVAGPNLLLTTPRDRGNWPRLPTTSADGATRGESRMGRQADLLELRRPLLRLATAHV